MIPVTHKICTFNKKKRVSKCGNVACSIKIRASSIGIVRKDSTGTYFFIIFVT